MLKPTLYQTAGTKCLPPQVEAESEGRLLDQGSLLFQGKFEFPEQLYRNLMTIRSSLRVTICMMLVSYRSELVLKQQVS